MIETAHKLMFSDSRYLDAIADNSVDLIVTSPPYPMIEMWDAILGQTNPNIAIALNAHDGPTAFELMHLELDKVWKHVARMLRPGAWACINVGDATRKIGNGFQLYSNHTRITESLSRLGMQSLPLILWRKQTNAPNKFMGSGMLPAGAYVTLEHEYILIFRKGNKRTFIKPEEINNRQQSSFFWEERNVWFSDIWDLKGVRQPLNHSSLRERSAAFPFEIAYRLINMYSVRNDWVVDPFLGTGTTTFAAIASCRNSIGVDVEANFAQLIGDVVGTVPQLANYYISKRLNDHLMFIKDYEVQKGMTRHTNQNYGFPVVTSQERNLILNYVDRIISESEGSYRVFYEDRPIIREETSPQKAIVKATTKDQ
jgi:modification methylase